MDADGGQLALAVTERLAPALPSGMAVVVTRGDVAGVERITELLSELADEASELTTDRYEGGAAVEGGRLRLWFGPVTGGAERPPELEAIVLDALSGR